MNMTMMKYTLIILSLWLNSNVTGQSYVDLINLTWDEGFMNDYDGGSNQARFYEMSADVTLPIVINENIALLTGFQYEQVNLDFESVGDDLKVHGMAIKVGASVNHGANWNGTYLLLPKISSDELTLEKKNNQVGAIALIKRNFSSQQNMRFGFYTNTELFGPFVVPLLGYYKATDKSEINILAPLAASYTYWANQNIAIGADFRGIIKSYQLNEQPGYLTKANNEVGAVVKVKWNKLIWQTIGGLTIGRNLRIYEDEDQLDMAVSALKFGDDRTQLNSDLNDGLFIKSSLIVRFPTGK
jgi:hypothetical protein